jgi:hypothetical protein
MGGSVLEGFPHDSRRAPTPRHGHAAGPVRSTDAQPASPAPEPPPAPCLGDLDGDNDVDLSDLAALLTNYGWTSGMTNAEGDLDCDGDVELADLWRLLNAYGTTCEQTGKRFREPLHVARPRAFGTIHLLHTHTHARDQMGAGLSEEKRPEGTRACNRGCTR